MSKVVLLGINSKFVHSTLAVWQLKAAVQQFAQKAHDVVVLECNINQPDEEIVAQVSACRPDVVGISTYIWNAGKLPGILRKLRKALPQAVFVMGGPEAAHNVDYWLENGANHVLKGAGEQTFPAFLDGREDGGDGCFVDPYTTEYLAALRGKIAYIETSRGCPFSCAFCLSGDSKVEFLPLDDAKAQIAKLAATDVRVIKFVDRTFNCDAKRAYEMIEFIMGLNTNNRFHFEVAADLFDQHTLNLLATAPAGLFQIEAGLQSFFKPTLEASMRKTNLDKAVANIKQLMQMGNIHIHLDLIAGLPHETLVDFAHSFNQTYAIGAHKVQLGFLKMLHGSALRRNEKSIIFNPEPPYEIISNPWLSRQDLQVLKRTENALQQTYNKGHFLQTLNYVQAATSLTPFEIFRTLGEFVQKDGMALNDYAEKLFGLFGSLKGVNLDGLRGYMIYDWLAMVKGSNMPLFMKLGDKKQMDRIRKNAEERLGRKLRRTEVAILPCGEGVFVDSASPDPVTGLYPIFRVG
ncbi:MAG: B12-binding domain-containing radical SAM protein [Defluviitaleaceae bacterium]|nr:B12-binding domain-containing radical SAM protein [Defluviitaleaceae bacterium]